MNIKPINACEKAVDVDIVDPQVTYRCLWKSKPHREGILKRICERKWGDISCYGSDRINILSAFYGRKTGGHICPGTVRTTSCETSAYSYVRRKCQDRQGCRLHAHNHHFGDPCYGTGKYLEVRIVFNYTYSTITFSRLY